MPVGNTLIIVAAILFPNLGGFAGSLIVRKNIKWLNRCVKKPSLFPPNYVFAPVWTILYCAIGYGSYLVYDDVRPISNGFDRRAVIALALYLIQLAFNWAWTPLFFGFHSFTWVWYSILFQVHLFFHLAKNRCFIQSYSFFFSRYDVMRLLSIVDVPISIYRVPLIW